VCVAQRRGGGELAFSRTLQNGCLHTGRIVHLEQERPERHTQKHCNLLVRVVLLILLFRALAMRIPVEAHTQILQRGTTGRGRAVGRMQSTGRQVVGHANKSDLLIQTAGSLKSQSASIIPTLSCAVHHPACQARPASPVRLQDDASQSKITGVALTSRSNLPPRARGRAG
jgi:hypothetical protein